MWRMWQHGDLVATGRNPAERLITSLADQAVGTSVHIDPESLRCNDGLWRAEARWQEEDGAESRVLLVLQDDPTPPRVRWLLLHSASRPWSVRDRSPVHRLGLLDLVKDCNDSSDSPMRRVPMNSTTFAVSDGILRSFLTALAQAYAQSTRTTALLLTSDAVRPLPHSLPGLLDVIVLDEHSRSRLADASPPIPGLPAGKLRLLPGPASALRPRVFAPGDPVLDEAVAMLVAERHYLDPPQDWMRDEDIALWWDRAASPRPLALSLAQQDDVDHLRSQLAERDNQLRIAHQQRQAALAEREAARTDAEQARLHSQTPSHDATELEKQLQQAYSHLDERTVERDELEAERDALIRDLAHTRGLLASTQPELTAEAVHERDFGGFAELFAAARDELTALTFTADARAADVLDEHHKAAVWRRRAWNALTSLNHYAHTVLRGRREEDFVNFLRSGDPGAAISPALVALTESRSTLADARAYRARVFPVAPATSPDGEALYQAHVRIEKWQAPAPRLHFYDDLTTTGTLYIGYLGPHLPIPNIT